MNMKQQYAVATREGLAISEHFGHAKQFYIYEVNSDGCKLLDKRMVRHYCLGGHSDSSALSEILDCIKDCTAVFVAKIGEGPTAKLAARGIAAVSEYAWEGIETSLLKYFAHHGS